MDGFADRALLPPVIGALPRMTRNRTTPAFPASVVDAIEAYLSELAKGKPYTGLASGHFRSPASPRTITSLREQLHWYFSCLVELGRLDLTGTPDVSELMCLQNILAAFEAERDGKFYWKPLALRTNMKNMGAVFRFARRYHPDLKDVQSEFFQQHYFIGAKSMTKTNEDFCRRLVRTPERVSRFLNLAGHLHHDAADLLDRFDVLTGAQKTRALQLSTAAATAAVLTFLPLRASTLVDLRVYGDNPHITFPLGFRNVTVAIPTILMKNKKPMTAEFRKRGKVDPRMILEWWLQVARAKVMERLHNADPARLMGGASYAYVAEAWRLGTAEHNIYMTLHQVRHAIASILLNEPGADVDCIAALLNDSPATVLRAYAFFDRDRAFERGQSGLASVNKALSRGQGARR
ncbi:hypothetical protein [Paracoccus fontiphilus]|uniref:Tyr recombinase domain-containing protein n=2 Tax=Paracoccus fontiphilus TaxID=1815556 RepID=A0ABV7IDQ4_9RHOB